MTANNQKSRSKKQLSELARRKGIAGWQGMTKDELIAALNPPQRAKSIHSVNGQNGVHANGHNRLKAKPLARPQRAAARNTTPGMSAEEIVERSKFDVGIPTKDLSAKVPKDLPTGYGKDRIVVMVRDPYWLHTYWELTRQAIARAEAALGQNWHGSKPILRVLDVTSGDTTSTAESI